MSSQKDWLEQYLHDGYLVIENLISDDFTHRMNEALNRIEEKIHSNSLHPYLSCLIGGKGSDFTNIMELPLFDSIFERELILDPEILDVLEVLFESSEFSLHNYKSIWKDPGGVEAFRWHRDLPYLPHTSDNLITSMLCIDPMTADNGATVVAPGTHRDQSDQVKPEDVDIAESEVPENRVTIECPAGSAVFFHAKIIHGGGPNLTKSKRRNVIGIWAGPDAHPVSAKRYAHQFVMPRSADPTRQKQVQMVFGS